MWKEKLPVQIFEGTRSDPTKALPKQNEVQAVCYSEQYKYEPIHQIGDKWGEYAEDYKDAYTIAQYAPLEQSFN